MNFAEYLQHYGVEDGLQDVLKEVTGILPKIAEAMRGGLEGAAVGNTQNVYGEKQLKLDVYANDLFTKALTRHPYVAMVASEELPESLPGNGGEEGYSVAYDPLDGSSLVDVNLAVGTIVGFYQGKGFLGRKGNEQVAALMAVYGPRLTFMVTVGHGVTEFIYDWVKKDFLVNIEEITLGDTRKMFAPGNLRACSDPAVKWYMDLMNYWVKNDYTLRYSGGMVPDVNQILKKSGGVFTYPSYSEMPNGKLRLLYECAPLAFLMEQAGGVAFSENGPIMDLTIEKLDQRTTVFLGSKMEVDLVLRYLKGQS
jgi:fructose-1,6-bisphosphatase I